MAHGKRSSWGDDCPCQVNKFFVLSMQISSRMNRTTFSRVCSSARCTRIICHTHTCKYTAHLSDRPPHPWCMSHQKMMVMCVCVLCLCVTWIPSHWLHFHADCDSSLRLYSFSLILSWRELLAHIHTHIWLSSCVITRKCSYTCVLKPLNDFWPETRAAIAMLEQVQTSASMEEHLCWAADVASLQYRLQ